ncbi:MAG: glycosyltransferase [Nitrospirota bacterium]|nr:glycosyltransferase [Nitrospirota bacterium]
MTDQQTVNSGKIPAIVVAAYNRPDALVRLLGTLAQAAYPEEPVTLVISIDKSDTDAVATAARAFDWRFGPKRIIEHPENLGLREHILACGDLSLEYGGVIVLEDDLLVSPAFYRYTMDAQDSYRDDPRIAGISLYCHTLVPYLARPFSPVPDLGDVFFIQFASSWGQAWSATQWSAFRQWYGDGKGVSKDDPLPDSVIAWPDSSWLKRFIKYMVESDRYFVFPRVSLTTNTGEPGTHFLSTTLMFQVPLAREGTPFRFQSLDSAVAVYDAHFEILPDRLNRLTGRLRGYDYAVDVHGSKDLSKVAAEYVLTTRRSNTARMGFGLRMKPEVANVIYGIEGEDLILCRRDANLKPPSDHLLFEEFCAKYMPRTAIRFVIRVVFRKLWRSIAGDPK